MPKFRTSFSERVRKYAGSGCPETPVFEFDENGELVDTGRKINTDAEIQSHKDEVLLSKIIERCGLTGESLLAPVESFGDATLMPRSILEAHEQAQRVQFFVNGLSDDDLKSLNEIGFDAFISEKIKAAAQKTVAAKEQSDHE